MAAITKIEFWKDVGFLEGAIEIPRLNAPDPVNPDLTIEPDQPIIPSKERFFSKLKVREYFDELMEMSYMRMTYELNDKTMIFYGWIREVSLESDGDLPMTVIDWHIDEWRTWKSAVTFGSGHVKRRPFKDLATTPIQNYPVRYYDLSNEIITLFNTYKNSQNRELWWIIVSYNYTYPSGETTEIYNQCFPVFHDRGRPLFVSGYDPDSNSNKVFACPTIDDVYTGYLDELCNLPPQSINGVWLSPIPPLSITSITGSGTSSTDPIVINGGPIRTHGIVNDPNTDPTNPSTPKSYTITAESITTRMANFTEITSSEEKRYVITDINGMKALDIPYGIRVSRAEITLFFEPTSAVVEISLKDGSLGNMIGCVAKIELPTIPVNSNAFSEYVYSGQREYDREARTIQSNANAWKSAASGGSTGALFGAVGPMGALAGLGAGVAPGMISYGVEMLYQNDEEQRILDRLMANQVSSMIFSSDSLLAFYRNYGLSIRCIVPDSYSAQQITATRNQFGISVDELMTSCDTLIRTTSPTGYFNIQNLIVGGDVPVSAKRWIREKFKTGVRLI